MNTTENKNQSNTKLELTQDEQGQLNGGFTVKSPTTNGVENHLWSDNGNCKGGGWFDDNVNCNRWASCDNKSGKETLEQDDIH